MAMYMVIADKKNNLKENKGNIPFERRKNDRSLTLDILKGIGIILMVAGHSGAPFTHFIYLFHMALFFITSGYLWNDKNVKNSGTMIFYVVKKLKTLWLPYLIGNGIFTLLNNLFIRLNIYTEQKVFLELVSEGHLIKQMDLESTICSLIKILFFAGGTQLGGATWFLRVLFVISIFHMVVRYIKCHWKWGNVFYIAIILLTIIGAEVETIVKFRLPMELQACFAAYFAYLMGVFIKSEKILEYVKKREKIVAVFSFMLLFILNYFGSVSMDKGDITNISYFLIVSVAGWILCWLVAEHVPNTLRNPLVYLGQHTMWIIILHFLSFKIVAFFYLWISDNNMILLASYPILENSSFLWIFYLAAGVGVPIWLEHFVKKYVGDIITSKRNR